MGRYPTALYCLENGASESFRGLRGGTVVRVGLARAEEDGVGEPGAWGEVTAGLRMSRPALVARLLELETAGALTTAHVRAGAHVGGVDVRTVWRWLDAERTEDRVERRPRARLELSDQAWEVLTGGRECGGAAPADEGGRWRGALAGVVAPGDAPGPSGRQGPAGPRGGAARAGRTANCLLGRLVQLLLTTPLLTAKRLDALGELGEGLALLLLPTSATGAQQGLMAGAVRTAGGTPAPPC